jgi:hypothetical protein
MNKEGYPMHEQYDEIKVDINKVVDGLFGEGSISYKSAVEQRGVTNEDIAKVEAIINSKDILVPVSVDDSENFIDDDGCGDGRGVNVIVQNGEKKKKSLHRAKIFGGGPAMAMASLIGVTAPENSVNQLYMDSISMLRLRGLDFGAHTDDHATGEKSGCGAIDNSPTIIQNAAKYSEQIAATIGALVEDTSRLEDVLESFKKYAEVINGQEYSGKKVMTEIAESGKVIKELGGDHAEMYIVLNDVEGYTVEQNSVRDATEGRVQIFVTDLWRLKQRAEQMFDTTQAVQQSYLSQLVFTLATAATLTAGDLPVYRVSKSKELILAS